MNMEALLASLAEVAAGDNIDSAQQMLDNAFSARATKQTARARDYTSEVLFRSCPCFLFCLLQLN